MHEDVTLSKSSIMLLTQLVRRQGKKHWELQILIMFYLSIRMTVKKEDVLVSCYKSKKLLDICRHRLILFDQIYYKFSIVSTQNRQRYWETSYFILPAWPLKMGILNLALTFLSGGIKKQIRRSLLNIYIVNQMRSFIPIIDLLTFEIKYKLAVIYKEQ